MRDLIKTVSGIDTKTLLRVKEDFFLCLDVRVVLILFLFDHFVFM